MIIYVTTSIPYVNGRPHLGHALEFVQADLLARHHRHRGRAVHLQSGTDDNALKNVQAARTADVPTRAFVDDHADRFTRLQRALDVSVDDFLRTGSDPRHRAGVEHLWQVSAERGDFYRRDYRGLYCAGCEQFYEADELDDGDCVEHPGAVEQTAETNWFFRLSAYAEEIEAALSSGRVRIEPAERRREVLAFVRAGLADISVSRSATRAGGWGIPVPGDPDQVVYVWWDALANYVTTLGVGSDRHHRWWQQSARRVHVIGKGIVRFHAVHWLGLLLSTGQQLPTDIFVHPYLSLDGAKISKSTGAGLDPESLTSRYGVDALRWWLLSDVSRVSDTDFTEDRLRRRYTQDLVGGVGNLVHRIGSLRTQNWGRVRAAQLTSSDHSTPAAITALSSRIDDHLDRFDPRAACLAVGDSVAGTNRYLETHRPWELARAGADGGRLAEVLTTALTCARTIAAELLPFVPGSARRLLTELDSVGTRPPRPVFEPLPEAQ